MYTTIKTVFDHITKHFKVCPKYSAARHILNSLLSVWDSDQIQYFVFDVMVIASFTISRFTSKNGTVYAIALQWPFTGVLALGAPISTENTQVTMLGYEGKFAWKPATDKGGLIVTVPCIPTNKLKSKWAWVFKLEYVH